MWVIFFYCIVSYLIEYAFHGLKHKIQPFYIYSAFTIIEYTLFALFLYLSFKGEVFKYILIICSLIFYVVALFNCFNKTTENFDSLSASVEAILIIVYGIFFLYEQIKDPAIFYIYRSKKFWIIIAFLIYFASTLFLFIYAATFTRQEHRSYWDINNIFNIVKSVLFTVSFAMKQSKKPEYSLENPYSEIY